jgi:hypothetical protein
VAVDDGTEDVGITQLRCDLRVKKEKGPPDRHPGSARRLERVVKGTCGRLIADLPLSTGQTEYDLGKKLCSVVRSDMPCSPATTVIEIRVPEEDLGDAAVGYRTEASLASRAD